jgi:hypothetical protein
VSELSRIDERLSQVVELLRCLVHEVRETRRALAEADANTPGRVHAWPTEERNGEVG